MLMLKTQNTSVNSNLLRFRIWTRGQIRHGSKSFIMKVSLPQNNDKRNKNTKVLHDFVKTVVLTIVLFVNWFGPSSFKPQSSRGRNSFVFVMFVYGGLFVCLFCRRQTLFPVFKILQRWVEILVRTNEADAVSLWSQFCSSAPKLFLVLVKESNRAMTLFEMSRILWTLCLIILWWADLTQFLFLCFVSSFCPRLLHRLGETGS